ncbi:MAG: hypothetical protein KatS3mg057_2270 [Herpetosiphonaceae bacterium]|nr:MAG: hypothetical protein KatS3mg057_2270 [Herpetosiphonaceae bacterium]
MAFDGGMLLYDQESLEKAAALDLGKVLARVVLVERLIGNIDYATHHLPDTFSSQPAALILTAVLCWWGAG